MQDFIGLFNECTQLDKQGRYRDSLERLTHVLALNPDQGSLFYERGIRFEQLGEFPSAFDDYSSAIDIDPENMIYFVSRGRLLCDKMGRALEAIADFRAAAGKAPDSPIPHQHMSLCYLMMDETENASIQAELALALSSGDASSHYCLAQCRIARSDWLSAIKELEKATGLSPNTSAYWAALGRAFMGAKDNEKARACYDNVIKIKPEANAYIRLARIDLESGESEQAINCLNLARQFELNDVEKSLVDGYLGIASQPRKVKKLS